MSLVHIIVGTRPNFIKAAPIIHQIQKHNYPLFKLIHTGQHFSREMSEEIFRDLELPKPDIYLDAKGGSTVKLFADIMNKYEAILRVDNPDKVIVFGDVTSTFATALTARMMGISVIHIEAGLRSRDLSMPEEINRILTDQISEELYVTEPSGVENLNLENISSSKVHHVGNIMIDSLIDQLPKIVNQDNAKKNQTYALVTLHRPSNVDNPEYLSSIIEKLNELSNHIEILFPVHPRTRKIMELHSDKFKFSDKIVVIEPQGYLKFMNLVYHSTFVLTDSGGIQEETSYLKIPCYTLRENTERPITIEMGTNELISLSDIPDLYTRLENKMDRLFQDIPLWDGKTAERIYTHLFSN